jgi:hypothetical protein
MTEDNNNKPNHNRFTYCVYWLGCRCCRLSVNTLYGRNMIGFSFLSFVSKHNMWSYYDWVVIVVVILCLLTEDNNNKPNHNTTAYCVYWRTTTTTTQPYYDHILCLLTNDNNDCRCCRSSVNTICGRIMIGLSLLSFVNKHNMWSYYYWVVVVVRQ